MEAKYCQQCAKETIKYIYFLKDAGDKLYCPLVLLAIECTECKKVTQTHMGLNEWHVFGATPSALHTFTNPFTS